MVLSGLSIAIADRTLVKRHDRLIVKHASELRNILLQDVERSKILALVRTMRLPDCWVGAGFVRNAVWDHLHGVPPLLHHGDVDVVWFDPSHHDENKDKILERRLTVLDPATPWSVKNQARMHVRNGDASYGSIENAMRCWPETATAVAVRLTAPGELEVCAPFGLDDLFDLILRPTPRFATGRYHLYRNRVHKKNWLETWPRLRLTAANCIILEPEQA